MKKKIVIGVVALLLLLGFLLCAWDNLRGRKEFHDAMKFPDYAAVTVVIKDYANDGNEIKLTKKEKQKMLQLLKKEAKFSGIERQNAISPITAEDEAFGIEISGEEYNASFLVSKKTEKNVLYGGSFHVKIGKMVRTRRFVKSVICAR